MERKLETPALRILEMLRKVAPNMELRQAYDHVDHYQELRDDICKDEFIVMMFLQLLGFDGSGNLRDKETAEKLKDAPDEIWLAIEFALNIHAGYVCSPLTPSDWVETFMKKHNRNKNNLQQRKESTLNILRDDF